MALKRPFGDLAASAYASFASALCASTSRLQSADADVRARTRFTPATTHACLPVADFVDPDFGVVVVAAAAAL